MAFSQSFTTSSLLGRPSVIVFRDTSTGSDVNIVEKHIYLLKDDGYYLRESGSTLDYIVWPSASNPFLLDILPKDMSLRIFVEWDDGDAGFVLINETDDLLINSTDKILL